MAVLEEIYAAAHEQFRETHKKRDQIIGFYLVIVAALIGAWDKLGDVRSTVLWVSWLVGLACLTVVTQYRRWHIVYTCSFPVLQRLMAEGGMLTLDRCERLWKAHNDTDTGRLKLMTPGRGVETTLVYLLAFINYLPLELLLRSSHWGLYRFGPRTPDVVPLLLNALGYLALVGFLSSWFVQRFFQFQPREWLWRWI